jgi:hypothetical protein
VHRRGQQHHQRDRERTTVIKEHERKLVRISVLIPALQKYVPPAKIIDKAVCRNGMVRSA